MLIHTVNFKRCQVRFNWQGFAIFWARGQRAFKIFLWECNGPCIVWLRGDIVSRIDKSGFRRWDRSELLEC